MDLYKKIRVILGQLLIDNGCRAVVQWYDKRHPDSRNKELVNSEEMIRLNDKIAILQRANCELENRIDILRSKEISSIKENDSMSADLKRKDQEISALREENNTIYSQIAQLQDENQKLLRRCLPERDIPSMIYYAQGDATGLYLRKVSAIRTHELIYRITTSVGDALSATFEPCLDSNIREIIWNRNITLRACEIVRIDPDASRIHVCEAGKILCVNNKWKVTNKAKIILS